jgi:hypothetical protein
MGQFVTVIPISKDGDAPVFTATSTGVICISVTRWLGHAAQPRTVVDIDVDVDKHRMWARPTLGGID